MPRPSLEDSERVDLLYGWPERLVKARESRGLTPRQLSEELGWNPSRLWRYEHGHFRPEPEAQASLAIVLQYPVAELFPRDPTEARSGPTG
jgi:transcriptional regulator with XRE-family HTH domain